MSFINHYVQDMVLDLHTSTVFGDYNCTLFEYSMEGKFERLQLLGIPSIRIRAYILGPTLNQPSEFLSYQNRHF